MMGLFLLDSGLEAGQAAGEAASFLQGNWQILLIGIALIVAAILIILLLKYIIVNSILGIIAWATIVFVFNIKLPFWVSLIVSAVFGLAGIGVLLLLKFLGIPL